MTNVAENIFWFASFIVIYSYVIYPMILITADQLFPSKLFLRSEDQPNVSIVIAAYNEEKVIERRIQNCLALDYPRDKLEVIIASDGSSDKTDEIVEQFKDQGVKLLGHENRRGKVNVLNEVVPQAKNDIVIFSDANTMFARDSVKKIVQYFADSRIGCVCGCLQFVNADGSKTGELEGIYWRYETMLKKLEGKRGALLGANGAIFAIRKNLFHECPADTIIEDFVLPMKILESGFKVVYDVEAMALEEAAHKIIHEKERRIRIGAGDFQALSRLWRMLDPRRGFPALAFLSHKVLRWFAPFFLVFAFASNIFLVSQPLYLFIFFLQCLFYSFAFVGQVLSWSGVNTRIFGIAYYFVSMNLALFLGLIRFLTNTQKVAWRRTER